MRFILLLCIIACALTCCYAQVLENVKTTFSGEKVIITYDLASPNQSQKFKITAFSAHDNYAKALTHVSGAVGENIAPGRGLRIEWDARSSLPPDFNGTISVRLKGVAMPQLSDLVQTSFKKGNTMNLSWTGGGKADKMNIELVRDDKVYKVIGNSIENSNTFNWKIPSNVKAGKDYTIRITDITDPMQPTVSSNFEIKPKIPMWAKIAVPVAVVAGVFIATQGGGGDDDKLPGITIKPD